MYNSGHATGAALAAFFVQATYWTPFSAFFLSIATTSLSLWLFADIYYILYNIPFVAVGVLAGFCFKMLHEKKTRFHDLESLTSSPTRILRIVIMIFVMYYGIGEISGYWDFPSGILDSAARFVGLLFISYLFEMDLIGKREKKVSVESIYTVRDKWLRHYIRVTVCCIVIFAAGFAVHYIWLWALLFVVPLIPFFLHSI
jgi:hypothetical protein